MPSVGHVGKEKKTTALCSKMVYGSNRYFINVKCFIVSELLAVVVVPLPFLTHLKEKIKLKFDGETLVRIHGMFVPGLGLGLGLGIP